MHRTTVFILTAAALALVALTLKPRAPEPRSHAPGAPPALQPPSAVHRSPTAPVQTGGAVTVTAALSHADVEPGGVTYAELHVRAAPNADVAPSAVTMALVVDVSGSMAGRKLEVAKLAARRFLEALQEGDRAVLVPFSSSAGSYGPYEINPETRTLLLDRVDALRAEGGTNLEAGLQVAALQLGSQSGSRRVVVLSDGQPTVGATTQLGLSQVVEGLHRSGLSATFLGVGDEFDARLLLALSEVGGGMYGSLTNVEALPEVLQQELSVARRLVARGVSVELRPADGLRVEHVVGFPSSELSTGSTVVTLPDLAAAADVTLFVTLRAAAGAPPELTLTAEPRWVEAASSGHELRGAPATVSARLAADATAAQRTRDEPRFARALKASGGEQLVQASAALERGDTASALGIFDNVRALFGASADALSGETAFVASQANELRANPGSAANRGMAKPLQRKALENFSERSLY